MLRSRDGGSSGGRTLRRGLVAAIVLVGVVVALIAQASTSGAARALPTAAATEKTAHAARSVAVTAAAAAADPEDVFVYQMDQADPVAVGSQITYTITVGANGPTGASGVTLTDTLPAGTTFVSAEPTAGSCSESAGTVTCTFGTILAGEGETVDIVVSAPAAPTTVTNAVAVTADQPDPSPGNNGASEETNVSPVSADLAVLQTDDADPAPLGADVTYTLTVSNHGPSSADGVTLVDTLPAGTAFVSTDAPGDCTASAGVVTCALGPMLPSDTRVIQLVVSAPSASADLSNTAEVHADAPPDPDLDNNEDTETGSVRHACFPAACITNGSVLLAVNPEGYLGVADGTGSAAGPGGVGLHFSPTGNDSLTDGCLCEGWGVADAFGESVNGSANATDGGPTSNMTLESFTTTNSSAVSVVNIQNTFRVTHNFHPSPQSPNLYEANVTITNIAPAAVNLLYRRVMDWDIEPTASSEYVTIQGGNTPELLFDSNDGLASANPLAGRSDLGHTGNFTDEGPDDHGALFDFYFGPVDAGQSVRFSIFYGVAANEPDALTAIAAVNATAYSLAEPSTPDGPTLGTPNTFVFAFRNGAAANSAPNAVDDTLLTGQGSAGTMNVLGNDSDPNNDPLTVTTFTQGAHGQVACEPDGDCVYTPDAGFVGGDSFQYTISDGQGGLDTATVHVTVHSAPTVDAGGDAAVAEGSLFSRAGSFSDPDADSWSATVDYGDGAGAVPLSLAADKSFQLSHTYLDNGSHTVTVTVDDGHASGSDSFQVAVSNVAPSVQAGLDATIAVGGSLSRPGSFSDPGSLDSWTASVDYGDGSGVQPLLLGLDHSFQLLHTYAGAGQFIVTVTVTDDDGGVGSDTVAVTVEAAPTFTLMVATAGSGSGQVTGPGIACPGDCSQSYTAGTPVVLHAAADPGSAFTGWSGDCAGAGDCSLTMSSNRSATATFVLPQNAAPTVDAGGDGAIAEGSLFSRAGSFSDPDADSWSATVDYGDGAGAVPLSLAADKSFQLSHTYLDNGSHTVTVTVDDGHASGSDSFQVAVSNAAPSVQAGPDATIAAGGTLSRPGSFSDPGSLDSWTATVNYGDGSGTQPLLLPGLDHSFQLLHTYTSPGQFIVTVTVTDDDGGAGSDTVTVTVEVPPSSADLSIAKSDAPDPALVGGTLVYTLTESNLGPTAADAITVTDVLPAGVVFVSATSTRGSCSQSAGVVTCTFASLPSGATASQTITVRPTQPGTITNSASVAASAPSDPDTSNNAATTSTMVNAVADLALAKTATPNPVQAGRSLGYALTVTNNGPSTATGVTVTDPLPATVSFAAASASQGDCSGTTTITCNLGALASGAQATVTITVTADQAGSVTNTASVSSETTDPSSSNNSATATTTVDPAADLALTKTVPPSTVLGVSLTYTLTVTNNGPSAAAGVTVSDTLPPNVTFDSAVSSAPGCNQSSGTVICAIGALAAGAEATVTIVVTPTKTGTITNTAQVSSQTADPVASNNVASAGAIVTADGGGAAADLALTQIAAPDPVRVGGELTYTVSVKNIGQGAAPGTGFLDWLPAGVELVSVAADQGSCDEQFRLVVCDLGTIPPDRTVTVTIRVVPNLAGALTNSAFALSSKPDPRDADNAASITTTVTS